MHTLKVINDRAAFLSNILPLPYKWCLFAPTLASRSEFRHSCSNTVWTDKEFAIQQGKRSALYKHAHRSSANEGEPPVQSHTDRYDKRQKCVIYLLRDKGYPSLLQISISWSAERSCMRSVHTWSKISFYM